MCDYKIQNIVVVRCQEFRDLGVITDSTLLFVPHIAKIAVVYYKIPGFIIRNLKEFKNPQCVEALYNAF